jgi:hypothetical protein
VSTRPKVCWERTERAKREFGDEDGGPNQDADGLRVSHTARIWISIVLFGANTGFMGQEKDFARKAPPDALHR